MTLLPSAIGIDAKASPAVQAEAEQFIEFVLSKRASTSCRPATRPATRSTTRCSRASSPLPALPSLAAVKTQTINPYTWGPREPTINTWFDSTIVR